MLGFVKNVMRTSENDIVELNNPILNEYLEWLSSQIESQDRQTETDNLFDSTLHNLNAVLLRDCRDKLKSLIKNYRKEINNDRTKEGI